MTKHPLYLQIEEQLFYKVKLILIIIFVVFSFVASSELMAKELIIASGTEGNGYHTLALSIKKICEDSNSNLKINVKKTHGSAENLELIRESKADLAIVQNDTAFYAENGLLFNGKPIENIRGVISFYQEPIFIVTRVNNINNINQLVNLKINVGQNNSGLQESAKVLLNSSGLWESMSKYYKSPEESIKLLFDEKIQAVFLNSISDDIRSKLDAKELFIVPISSFYIKDLNNTFPFFSPYEYKLDELDVITTISVTSILVARDDLDSKVTHEIVKLLDKEYKRLTFPSDSLISEDHFGMMPLEKWHHGVVTYLGSRANKKGKKLDAYLVYMLLSLLILIIFLIILALAILHYADFLHRFHSSHKLIRFLRNIYLKIVQYKYISLIVAMGLLYLTCILLIRYFEHKWALQNNTFSSFDAQTFPKLFSWLFVFSSSGFDDNLFPKSDQGKLVVSLVPLLGMGGAFAFVGLITFDRVKKYFLEVNGMTIQKVKDHIILCGWNDKAHFIVKNLLHENLDNRKQIVILTEFNHEEGIKKYNLDPMFVYYVKGQGTNRDDLKRANIAEASLVIAISDNSDTDPDARTILKILTAKKYCSELVNCGKRSNDIFTVAELFNPQNISIAEDAGADQIVSLSDMESKIFTQAVRNPGVAVFINEIMTYNDQNDIYSFIIEEGSTLIGKTYDELLIKLRKYNILLMSINIKNRKSNEEISRILEKNKLDSHVITNPLTKAACEYQLHTGDLVIVLAQYEKVVLQALKKL